jgi:hypothetical protein
MSPGGNHFLGAGDMGRASMAKYLHEKRVGTGHERSFYILPALRSGQCAQERIPAFGEEDAVDHVHLVLRLPYHLSLFFKDGFAGSEKGVPELVEALAKAQRALCT